MIFRRILFALALAAFAAPIGSYAATPKTMATHKPAVKQAKCKPTKTHKCYGGPAPSHM
jgi:hypothetical protein